jgi:hypothetical protein
MSHRPGFEGAFDPTGGPSVGGGRGRDSQSDERRDTDSCGCSFVPEDAPGEVYNEEAFRYFLEIERKRSERSRGPFLLLLVDLKRQSMATPEIDRPTARKLFSALLVCVRETDFIGWYRARSVVGAVLTQHADTSAAELQEAVGRRVTKVLREGLPPELASLVQVRVYQLPPAVQDAS